MRYVTACVTLAAAGNAGPASAVDHGPVASHGTLEFDVDTAIYGREGGRDRLEVNTLLDAVQLRFAPTGGRFTASLNFTLTVVDTALKKVAETEWVREIAIREPTELYAELPFRDQNGVSLVPGRYGFSLKVEEAGGRVQGTAARLITVPAFGTSRLEASDLLLALRADAREGGYFRKGSWDVVPKVDRNFSVSDSVYVYYEIYNLAARGDAQDEPFVVTYSFVDARGVLVRKTDEERVAKQGSSATRIGRLGTDDLAPGRYRLILTVYDVQSRESVQRERVISLGPWRGVRASDGTRRSRGSRRGPE